MRPLNVGELLDASFAAVRRNFAALVLCTLVAVVPVSIVNTLVQASTSEHAFDFLADTTVRDDSVGVYVAGLIVTNLLTLVAFSLATAACLRTVGGDVVGSRVGARESLGYAASRLGPLVLVSLLYLLSLLLGVLMCLIGIVWMFVLFALATPAVLFEDHRGVAAMRRSRDLIAGNWWRVFGVMLIMYLIVAVLTGILAAALTSLVLVNSDSEVLNAVILTAANIVSYALTLPLVAATITHVYFDLRVRKEGFDLQLLAQRIGPETAGAPPAPAVQGLPGSDAAPDGGGFLPPQSPRPPAA